MYICVETYMYKNTHTQSMETMKLKGHDFPDLTALYVRTSRAYEQTSAGVLRPNPDHRCGRGVPQYAVASHPVCGAVSDIRRLHSHFFKLKARSGGPSPTECLACACSVHRSPSGTADCANSADT